MSSVSDEELLTPVQQICMSGYTLEQATKALEMYDNIEDAMQHLLNAEINTSPIHDSDESDEDLKLPRYICACIKNVLYHVSLYFPKMLR